MDSTDTARRRFRRLPSPAMLVAIAALTVALGGTAVAVTKAPKNSVVSKSIKNGQVKAADLARGAVKTPKIAPGAVDGGKLANGAVGAEKLADGAVTTPRIAHGAVDQGKIAEGAVTSGKIAAGAVGLGKLDGAVSNAFRGVGPVTYESATSGATDGGQAASTAHCPEGSFAIAGGVSTTAAANSDDVIVNASRPNVSPANVPPSGNERPNSWRVVVVNTSGGTNAGTIQVTAYAVCAV